MRREGGGELECHMNSRGATDIGLRDGFSSVLCGVWFQSSEPDPTQAGFTKIPLDVPGFKKCTDSTHALYV